MLLGQQPLGPRPAGTPVRTVHDRVDGLSFELPLDWPLSTRDRELSTFRHEARSAPRTARLRYVAAMPENPFPASTFSGAHFYLSVTPSASRAQCAAQAGGRLTAQIDDQPASHGHDEHGGLCTEFRDEVYTVRRRGSCLRIDLAMNNFCGGAVSGVADLTPEQLGRVRGSLEAILRSIRFDR